MQVLLEGFNEFSQHVHEAVAGEDNKVVVQWVASVIVGASAKCVSFIGFARFVAELEVVLLKFNLPGGGVGSYFLGLTPVYEIFVISLDDNGLIQGSGVE